jgi:hypothetical protein
LPQYIYFWKETEHGRRLFRKPSSSPTRQAAPPPSEPPSSEESSSPDLSSLKKDELVALAESRGIDSSGKKADIIERLEA